MRNRFLLALLALFIAGGFFWASAQTGDVSTTRVKHLSEVTPSWTYKGHWKGFITCNRLQRDGNMTTPDQVKQCINAGGVCILIAPGFQGQGRMDLAPKDKCDEFAGQEVMITGLMTSRKYGTGPGSDPAIEGRGRRSPGLQIPGPHHRLSEDPPPGAAEWQG